MREVGPAAKVLINDEREPTDGDTRRTKPYIGPGRALLGMLKNSMKAFGNSQGKMTRDWPDGTRIIVESMYGLDKIRIIAPPMPKESPEVYAPEMPETPPPPDYELPTAPEDEVPETPPPPVEEKEDEPIPVEEPVPPVIKDPVEVKTPVVCGNMGDNAWVWSPGAAAVTILPHIAGGTNSQAYAISADATTVVGVSGTGTGVFYPVRWRNRGADGWQPEQLGPADGLMVAKSVNRDGTVITGSGFQAFTTGDPFERTTNPAGEWVWTAATGILRLGSSFHDSTENGAVVSPDGQRIAGQVWNIGEYVTWYRPAFPSTEAFADMNDKNYGRLGLWEREPADGAVSGPAQYFDGLDFTSNSHDFDSADGGGPMTLWPPRTLTLLAVYSQTPSGVSNEGVIVGSRDSDTTGFVFEGGGFNWLNPPVLESGPRTAAESTPVVPTCITADSARIGGYTFTAADDSEYWDAWMRIEGVQIALGTGAVTALTVDDGETAVGWAGSNGIIWTISRTARDGYTATQRYIPGNDLMPTGVGQALLAIDEDGAYMVSKSLAKGF